MFKISKKTLFLLAACAQVTFGQDSAATQSNELQQSAAPAVISAPVTDTAPAVVKEPAPVVATEPVAEKKATPAVAKPQDDNTTTTLDQIVVTATKTSKKMSTAPAAISVVTKEDMAKHSYQGIDEALKYEQGVYNKRSKGLAETMAGIVMRGFAGADQILVLVDGQPMNNGYIGRVQFNHIQMDDIDKIEVVRGPFSSLYGGNAMGGVVSLITKKPVKKEFHSRSYYGSNGSYGLSTSYADYIADRLGFRFSAGYKNSEGYSSDDIVKTLGAMGRRGTNVTGVEQTTTTLNEPRIKIGQMGNNGADNWNVNGKLYYDINENHTISLGVQNASYRYWRDYGSYNLRDSLGNAVDTGYITYRVGDTTYYQKLSENSLIDGPGKQSTTYYSLGYDGQATDKIKLKFRSGFANQYDNWYTSVTTTSTRGNGPGKLSTTPNMKGNAELSAEMTDILPLQSILAGISLDGAKADAQEWNLSKWYDETSKTTQTYMAKGKSGSGAIFLQDEIKVLKDVSYLKSLSVYAGLRGDYWMSFDGANRDFTNPSINNTYERVQKGSVSPKLAVAPSLEFGDMCAPTFRIAGGKAFRPPTIYDLYRTWHSGTTTYVSNPDLVPEETWSIEGGTTTFFWHKRLQLSLTGYYNRISNMIYTSKMSDTVSQKQNAGKAKTKGIESGIVFAPVSPLKLYANYTWTDSRILENEKSPVSVGKQVTGVPEHVFQLGTSMNWKELSFAIDGRYVSKRWSRDDNTDTVSGVYGSRDAVTTWDAALGYTINKSITVLIKVDNIGDAIVFDYYRMPGRVWTGEIKVDF
jgi:iron complex outermembrane recepter protein